ncbi:hypothetical protein TNCT_239541 [Trichonephila clavata]|uniref:SURP motif domain-containing protein n=1 Tax=Trichonephila clavata TaxID=2740835 RepID=A0A8X6H0Z0_TRICU|nr:hypothetical protein TNCT_239541 [Trichonephila clavata]
MADADGSWSHNPCKGPSDPNEKLFVFGYSCKIFPDDDKAAHIDQGKHLIPWNCDKSLMIDRYDVRGYLHDLKQYEPKPDEYEDPFDEEEKLCNEERYRSLRSDMSEEQLYQEEELKRLRAALANDGAYHEIGFTYDNEQYVEPEASKVDEPEDELYQVPEGLTVPKGMEVPYNMKIHTIIEKTAEFVSEQGGQMEIIIKMKQQANPQFAFMHLDNPLYPYYKHLVKVIKAGTYKPAPRRKISRSEDEDDDGHYLHPSLMSGKQEAVPKFTVPNLNFRRSHDDSYSVLVRNLQKQHETSSPLQDSQHNSHEGSDISSPASDDDNNELKKGTTTPEPYILPPPPDMQPVVDKMAEYVAKNGEDFEIIVKSKKDTRFDFLHSWHEFYNYYIYKRNVAKAKMQDNNALKTENTENLAISENIYYDLQKPIVHESGPVFYSNIQPSDQPQTQNEEIYVPTVSTVPLVQTNDSLLFQNSHIETLHSQDSQDATPQPQSAPIEVSKDDNTFDSTEFLNSPKDEKMSNESKTKPTKVLKGPISFSLKPKDTEVVSEKAKLTPLLMDDSEDESGEEGKPEKETSSKRTKSIEEHPHMTSSKHHAAEVEVKSSKPSNEFLEAKQAEERIRDKLLSAARERLAQQRKEKQQQMEQQKREEQMKKEKQQQLDQQKKERELQLERKKKATLFLKMVGTKPDSTAVVSHFVESEKNSGGPNAKLWTLPKAPAVAAQGSGILFHGNKMLLSAGGLPGIKAEWSSDSMSEHSGEEEPISVIGEKLSSDPEVVEEPAVIKTERKKKKRKRSRSKSKERSRSKRSKTPRRSRDKHRSRSRSRRREKKKEKQLPAAYALSKRSRSRSRSPRRYRPSFSHWNRRR